MEEKRRWRRRGGGVGGGGGGDGEGGGGGRKRRLENGRQLLMRPMKQTERSDLETRACSGKYLLDLMNLFMRVCMLTQVRVYTCSVHYYSIPTIS